MVEERAWYLLSLQLSGEATAEELKELNGLLQQHPELNLRMEVLRNIWRSKQQPLPSSPNHFDKHLQRLSTHLATPVMQYEEEKRRSYHWLWAAAAVAAMVIIVLLVTLPGNTIKNTSLANTISTRPGSKSKIELPDGTQVWLNADSRIKYNQNFMDSTREVILSGEAYFDVVPAISHTTGKKVPFIIHTRSLDIKVLGTAFNVRSYPHEKTTETSLIHGSVEVTLHNSPDKKIVLKPKEKLIINDDSIPTDTGPILTVHKLKPYKNDSTTNFETMWVANKLAFENEPFDRTVAEIERWYNVTMFVKNESLNKLQVTAVFEDKSLNEVMEALSIAFKFKYEIKNNQVNIW